MSPSYHANLELVLVDWLNALRNRDLEAITVLLDPGVEQRWIDGRLYCANREQLVAWIGGRISRSEFRVDAVEVVVGDEDHVAMGVRGPDLEEVGGEYVGGQLYEVFTIRDGRIVAIRHYLRRDEALAAAGARSVPWR
jgi:ketosteroid isomerase-like protein